MAGLCNNNTQQTGSIVTPYVCHRNIGLWTLDELDEEGTVKFETLCPTPEQYPLELRATCPRVDAQHDDTPNEMDIDDYPNSGDTPLSVV